MRQGNATRSDGQSIERSVSGMYPARGCAEPLDDETTLASVPTIENTAAQVLLRLSIVSTPDLDAPSTVRIDPGCSLIIGRDVAAPNVALNDELVSRSHARIHHVDGNPCITDLGSRN